MTGCAMSRHTASSVRRIASAANPTVKALRALHQKKHRSATGCFLAEGVPILTEAVELGHVPQTLVMLPELRDSPRGSRLVETTLTGGGEVLEASQSVLAKIVRKDNPSDAVGAFPQVWWDLNALDARGAFCWIVLEAPRDPGNVGTVLRTADAVGAQGAILLDRACDPYSVEGVRASMGAIFAQRLVHTSFDAFAEWRSRQGGRLVGTSLNAPWEYQAVTYPRPTFLFMGNEHSGLPSAYEQACDTLVRLPMCGRAESLNLAVAASVMLYEIYNQDRHA